MAQHKNTTLLIFRGLVSFLGWLLIVAMVLSLAFGLAYKYWKSTISFDVACKIAFDRTYTWDHSHVSKVLNERPQEAFTLFINRLTDSDDDINKVWWSIEWIAKEHWPGIVATHEVYQFYNRKYAFAYLVAADKVRSVENVDNKSIEKLQTLLNQMKKDNIFTESAERHLEELEKRKRSPR